MKKFLHLLFAIVFICSVSNAQQSVARQWNEVMLDAIREDLARPPVQARNLFHVSLAMYDAWAAYDAVAKTYLIGKTVGGVYYPYTGITLPAPASIETYRNTAISYAVYRVLVDRYTNGYNPNAIISLARFNNLMTVLGYSPSYSGVNYSNNDPRDLGNYIGQQIISMGYADGSRQANNFQPITYAPVNGLLDMQFSGNTTMTNPNRWQRLFLVTSFDQNGNPIPSTQRFICPEWGKVLPFAMPTASAVHYTRDGGDYPVYYDPGVPPMLDTVNVNSQSSLDFKWGHTMVAAWSSHLDPTDNVMWDISPKSMGNNTSYPTTIAGERLFYNFSNGGDPGVGYTINPVTGAPYTPQMVKRGDYTRIVAQYWADGPSSETPPGHWFTLLNKVSDYPGFLKKYEGIGTVLSDLEWDVKSYFTLSGALHDAAIACWGIKGWYDSPRPVSTIRKMAAYGQSSNSLLPSYHPGGLPLIPGFIELVNIGDPLAGAGNVNVNKVKIKAWRGYSFIINPFADIAGVGWILAESWTPYQTSTFVTPPFAGYTSGHSTYSRAGATILTSITGTPYFPGGLGETVIPANSGFITFEASPTTEIKLQWATYKDASDQASLSRIWGGIHPPFDDMPGRAIGEQVGIAAHNKAKLYFTGSTILPVNLISFTAEEQACGVEIKWATSSELGAKTFTILRSEDGINFNTKIAVINAQGNSTSVNKYQCRDASPFTYNYYKLIETDVDGKQVSFPIVIVKMKNCALQTDMIAAIAPNPIVADAKVVIQNYNKNDFAVLLVSDVLGKPLLTQTVKLQTGFNNINLPLQKLNKGSYFVKISLENGKVSVQKIVKY